MHPIRRQRLLVVLAIVVFSSAAIGLAAFALRTNINLFYPPAEVAAGAAPIDTRIRVGGMVVDGTFEWTPEEQLAVFDITDGGEVVTVAFKGVLPDLFREGQGIVAQGYWREGQFEATEVLAKHDENYMPKEVTAALREQGHFRGDDKAE